MSTLNAACVMSVAEVCRSLDRVRGALGCSDTGLISVHDWGFLRGMGVFESMRWERGKIPFLHAHLTRLVQSCERLQFAHPPIDELARRTFDWTKHVCVGDESAIVSRAMMEARVRVVITAGPTGRGAGHDGADGGHVVWMLEGLAPVHLLHDEPIDVVTVTGARFSAVHGGGAGIKTLNYLSATMADRRAMSFGAHEAIAVTDAGEVLEGTRSNVCIVNGRTLRTPPTELGILPGIARAFVMRQWAALGYEVRQQVLHPCDLYEADEVLLTNSVRGVRSVGAIDGYPLPRPLPGVSSVGALLQRRWRDQWGGE